MTHDYKAQGTRLGVVTEEKKKCLETRGQSVAWDIHII